MAFEAVKLNLLILSDFIADALLQELSTLIVQSVLCCMVMINNFVDNR